MSLAASQEYLLSLKTVLLCCLYCIYTHKLIWLSDTQQTNIVFTLRNRNLDTKATVQLENNLSIFIFPMTFN